MEMLIRATKIIATALIAVNIPSVGAQALQNTSFTLLSDNQWNLSPVEPQLVAFVTEPNVKTKLIGGKIYLEINPKQTSLANGLKPTSYMLEIISENKIVKTVIFFEKHDIIKYSEKLEPGLYKFLIYGKAYTHNGEKLSNPYESKMLEIK